MAVSVLHVCDKFGVAGSSIHGVSRLFSWWFPRYDKARFQVSLCGLKAPEPASELLRGEGVEVTHLRRGPFDPRLFFDLLALARERSVRILHVHGYASADFGRMVARRVGASLILHEHFADPRMPRYQAWADRLLSGRTDRAIAVSGSTRDFLVRERYVPPAKVRLIWNGAPLQTFRGQAQEGATLRKELGLSDEAVVIGSVARLSLQKGHRFLVDAFAGALRGNPAARLLVVGDGDQEAALKAQAARAGIDAQTIFTGHRTDVPAVLAAMDVFAISSVYEGTPLTLFEAMAAGKAIVSTAVDGCKEVLEEGRTGLLVPPEDAAALGVALRRLVEDSPLRRSLGEEARRASSRFDIQATVEAMEALYDEVLGERAAS